MTRSHRWDMSRQPYAGLLSLLVVSAAWYLFNAMLGGFIVPSPGDVLRELVDLFGSRDFYLNLVATLSSLSTAFAIAAGTGVVLGVCVGMSALTERAFVPFLSVGNATPMLALIPVLIVWLGLGTPSIVAGAVLLGVFPITISTVGAVRGVDRKLLEVADVSCASKGLRLWAVTIPSAWPGVVNGLRISIGRVFIGVVAGEMLIGSAGLGWSADRLGESLNMSGVVAHIIVLSLMAIAGFKLFDITVTRISPWLPPRRIVSRRPIGAIG